VSNFEEFVLIFSYHMINDIIQHKGPRTTT